jgi:gliding motility-associated protein GldE
LVDDGAQSSLTEILTQFNILQYFSWNVEVFPALFFMVLLILLSALVSGAEVAFFSLNVNQIQTLDLKRKKDNRINWFLSEPEKLLGTILVGNNLFNVAFIVTSYFTLKVLFDFGEHERIQWIFETITITSFLVLFGEIIPKTYASKNNMTMARLTINLLTGLFFIIRPLVSALNKSTSFIQNRLKNIESSMTADDIDKAIELTVKDDAVKGNRNILKSLVKFGNTSVKQIMQSRVDVVAINKSVNFEEVISVLRDSGYSRMPVYEDSFDNVIGIIYAKDLLEHYLDQGVNFNWQKLLRPAFYVPESKKIDDLLEEFRSKRIHMAIVVDEYGGASGLVTLEDVLEEVIGEIVDEFDSEEEEINFKKIDEHKYLFQGKTQLNDVCRVINIPVDTFNDVKGESDSLAGLILEMNGTLPKSGQVISYKNYDFKIITVNNIRIVRVQITINDTEKNNDD